MPRSRKKHSSSSPTPAQTGSTQDASSLAAGGAAAARSWWTGKGPIIRFVVILLVLMGVFNAFFNIWLIETDFFNAYLHLNARVCGALLGLLGSPATVHDSLISTPLFALEIKTGCDAIQASAFFVFIVLASPLAVSVGARMKVIIAGVAVLLLLNLVRIIALYYTGVHYPSLFETMHVEVWQAVFIFLPILMWLAWVQRTGRQPRASADAPAT